MTAVAEQLFGPDIAVHATVVANLVQKQMSRKQGFSSERSNGATIDVSVALVLQPFEVHSCRETAGIREGNRMLNS